VAQGCFMWVGANQFNPRQDVSSRLAMHACWLRLCKYMISSFLLCTASCPGVLYHFINYFLYSARHPVCPFAPGRQANVVQVLCYSTTVQYDTALGTFLQLYNHTGRCMSLAAVRLQPTTHKGNACNDGCSRVPSTVCWCCA
jgi:hypothetical protein